MNGFFIFILLERLQVFNRGAINDAMTRLTRGRCLLTDRSESSRLTSVKIKSSVFVATHKLSLTNVIVVARDSLFTWNRAKNVVILIFRLIEPCFYFRPIKPILYRLSRVNNLSGMQYY